MSNSMLIQIKSTVYTVIGLNQVVLFSDASPEQIYKL